MKVAICIITYNIDCRIFLLQVEAIRRFCKDDFEIQIIENSSNAELGEAIIYHAKQLEISWTKTNAASFNGSESHVFAATLAYERFKNDGYDILCFLDHDVIPLKDFSLAEILGEEKVFGGMGQGKNGKTYYWLGLVFWNTNKIDKNIIELTPSIELGLDSGGNLYKAIDVAGKENCVFFDESYHQNPYFNGRLYNHYVMINKGMFMHCINSSNWNFIEDNEERMSSLVNIIREKILN